jgi:RimJ/RimL family protein N-acetyltransferase
MNYDFTTERLIVKEWHSFKPSEINETNLADIVTSILIPEITIDFPIMWRGSYNTKRSLAWIKERDSESTTLLAVDKNTKNPIGFINFFKVGKVSKGINLRLGYTLAKKEWGKGFATELVEGFIHSCEQNDICTLSAGVNPTNIASIRVLEKNNFFTETLDTNGIDLLFNYDLIKQKRASLSYQVSSNQTFYY